MDGFKNVEISNFRGIDHLKIEDFSRVNIFLGQNNSGKSTVLEALSLLTGMANPDTPLNINRFRTRNLYSPFKDLYYIFHNMDLKTGPKISAEQLDGDTRNMRLQLSYVFNDQDTRQESGINGIPPFSETKTFFKKPNSPISPLKVNETSIENKNNKYRTGTTVLSDSNALFLFDTL